MFGNRRLKVLRWAPASARWLAWTYAPHPPRKVRPSVKGPLIAEPVEGLKISKITPASTFERRAHARGQQPGRGPYSHGGKASGKTSISSLEGAHIRTRKKNKDVTGSDRTPAMEAVATTRHAPDDGRDPRRKERTWRSSRIRRRGADIHRGVNSKGVCARAVSLSCPQMTCVVYSQSGPSRSCSR